MIKIWAALRNKTKGSKHCRKFSTYMFIFGGITPHLALYYKAGTAIYRVVFFNSPPPLCLVPKWKKANAPSRSSFKWKISWNSSSDWLLVIFNFGTDLKRGGKGEVSHIRIGLYSHHQHGNAPCHQVALSQAKRARGACSTGLRAIKTSNHLKLQPSWLPLQPCHSLHCVPKYPGPNVCNNP